MSWDWNNDEFWITADSVSYTHLYYRLEDVQAIKHFQSLGNLFGVCTGRSYKGIEDFNPHQIDYDFYILCSGAKILDKEGNLIYQKFIDKKIAQSIYEQYEAVDTSIVYQGDMYVLNRTFDLSPRVKLITSFNQVGEQFEDVYKRQVQYDMKH